MATAQNLTAFASMSRRN